MTAPPEYIPDTTGPIIAERIWQAKGDRLSPAASAIEYEWSFDLNEAECGNRSMLETTPDAVHAPPAEPEIGCNCGFWGLRDLPTFITHHRPAFLVNEYPSPRWVFGKVALSGRVYIHEDGWRAEHARVVAIYSVPGSGWARFIGQAPIEEPSAELLEALLALAHRRHNETRQLLEDLFHATTDPSPHERFRAEMRLDNRLEATIEQKMAQLISAAAKQYPEWGMRAIQKAKLLSNIPSPHVMEKKPGWIRRSLKAIFTPIYKPAMVAFILATAFAYADHQTALAVFAGMGAVGSGLAWWETELHEAKLARVKRGLPISRRTDYSRKDPK